MSLPSALFAGVTIALVFSGWVYGVHILWPDEIAWLLHGDPAQHLLGATQFLAQPWQWPPGAIPLQPGQGTSIVFVDAVPLIAFVAKAIQWPAAWQYFGIWIWFSHTAIVVIALLLLNRLGLGPINALIGACFFLFAPTLLLRAYGHEALMAHWLILWSMLIALSHYNLWRLLFFVVISLLTHPYLGAMALAFGILILMSTKTVSVNMTVRLQHLALVLFVSTSVMWAAGYFQGSSERSAGGYGFFSANLLTWFDPMEWLGFLASHGRPIENAAQWSRWIVGPGQATAGQYEGFAYLGAGGLLLLGTVLGLGALRYRAEPIMFELRALFSPLVPWLLMAAAMAIFAVSSKVTFGPHVVAQIAMPQIFSEVAGIFRASGRFIWPLTYFVLIFVVVVAGRQRHGSLILAAALIVQGIDLGPKLYELKVRFGQALPAVARPATAEDWSELLRACPRLVIMGDLSQPQQWAGVAIKAAAIGVTIDGTAVARPREAEAELRERRLMQLIKAGEWQMDTVYLLVSGSTELGQAVETWVRSPQWFNGSTMRYQIIDGYHVAHSQSCK
jgi:Family of unknown function (DUF6311)